MLTRRDIIQQLGAAAAGLLGSQNICANSRPSNRGSPQSTTPKNKSNTPVKIGITIISEENCINCGACEPECPNEAIEQGEEVYMIDPDKCTACVGHYSYLACQAVCPVECCIPSRFDLRSEDEFYSLAINLEPTRKLPPLSEGNSIFRYHLDTKLPKDKSVRNDIAVRRTGQHLPDHHKEHQLPRASKPMKGKIQNQQTVQEVSLSSAGADGKKGSSLTAEPTLHKGGSGGAQGRPHSATELFDILQQRVAARPDKARVLDAIYQFKITGAGGGEWHVDLSATRPAITKGTKAGAICTIEVAHADFMNLLTNPASGMQLFMTGKMKVTGDPMQAMKLSRLFGL